MQLILYWSVEEAAFAFTTQTIEKFDPMKEYSSRFIRKLLNPAIVAIRIHFY